MTRSRLVRKTSEVNRTADTNELVKSLLKKEVFDYHPALDCWIAGFDGIVHAVSIKSPAKLKLKVSKIIKNVADDRLEF